MAMAAAGRARAPVLIAGGLGKTGRRVADRLRARGWAVRIGSRSAVPPFDWSSPDGWESALQGVGSIYATYQPDLSAAGAIENLSYFAVKAKAAGVRRIVMLTGRGDPNSERAESVLADSGLEWAAVRPSWFSQNFSEGDMRDPIRHGLLALPVDTVAEPFVDAEDIADVAVAALTEDGHDGQVYELTGPEALTFGDAVAKIREGTGLTLKFQTVSEKEYRRILAEAHVPPQIIDVLVHLFTTVLDGRNSHLADGVQRALGRPPRSFGDFVADAARSGAWSRG